MQRVSVTPRVALMTRMALALVVAVLLPRSSVTTVPSVGSDSMQAVPQLPWPKDTQPDGPCGISYSPRFSHGGGCSERTDVDGSPHVYCRSFGKQRAVVSVESSGHACASLPWRRYDDPARHTVVVTDASGNIVPSNVTNSSATVGEVCFTAPAPGFFAMYFLPFRWAAGLGSGSYCSFFLKPGEFIGPDAPPSQRWDVLSTWTVASGVAGAQNFTLTTPTRGRSFRYATIDGYSQYQSYVRELRIQTKENGWLTNRASAKQVSPVKSSSGWQPCGDEDGHPWAAMDGNLTTLWDPTCTTTHCPNWLELQFDEAVTVVAISVLAGSGGAHMPKTIQFQQPHNHSVAPPAPVPGHSAVATFVRFESKTPFDSRSPMELMASTDEISAMTRAASRTDYLTFTSAIGNTTLQSIRLDALPASLVASGPNTTVAAGAKPGQFVVIQVAVFALQDLNNLTVKFNAVGAIAAEAMTCFQTEGIDANGNAMPERPWTLSRGKVGALLIGIAIPQVDDTTTSELLCSDSPHTGSFMLVPANGKPTNISVAIEVECDAANPHEQMRIDTSDLDRLERLSWLNSRTGLAATVTRPYHPLEVTSRSVTCLGRTVQFGPTGLPSQITANGINLLSASGVKFEVTGAGAATSMIWQPQCTADVEYSISLDPNGTTARWSVSSTSSDGVLKMKTLGEMSYDGYINLAVSLESTKDIEVDNIVLVSSLPQRRAKYAIGAGLGDDGAYFPYHNLSKIAWRWTAQAEPGQQPVAGGPVTGGNGFRVWLGDVTAGMHLKLKGRDPGWNRPNGDPNAPGQASPGETPFPTWANGNRGGWSASVDNSTSTVSMTGYTGKRSILAGETLLFNFSIMPTPTKGAYLTSLKAKEEHYHQFRHYHIPYGQWVPDTPASLHKLGATTIILHQSNRLNPYIDWPFASSVMPMLADYVDEAAALGMHVKMYFTLGQMTNHMAELFALKSLGGEILLENSSALPPAHTVLAVADNNLEAEAIGRRTDLKVEGMGNGLVGNEWLEEHMVTGYRGGWFTMNPGDDEDASIADSTSSRMLNYYIKGQEWLYREMHLGGLYYDGNDGTRDVQQRIRRMTEALPTTNSTLAVFDVHGRAFDYVEELPFFDSMWTCEGIDFTQGSDYWLISIAAIPFGVLCGNLSNQHNYERTARATCCPSC